MPGITFDTGALIGLERRHDRMRKVYATAVANGIPITVPTVVVAEWWRAGRREIDAPAWREVLACARGCVERSTRPRDCQTRIFLHTKKDPSTE